MLSKPNVNDLIKTAFFNSFKNIELTDICLKRLPVLYCAKYDPCIFKPKKSKKV